MINKAKQIWEWLQKHPKLVYTYSSILLILSLGVFIVEVFFITPKTNTGKMIPLMFGSDQYINEHKKKEKVKQQKLEQVIKELEAFQVKETLEKRDSIRIEYLLNQYNTLKNEGEKN